MDIKEKTGQRYELIDAFRGIALLNMVFYHFFYDIYVIYGKNPNWTASLSIIVWERFICISFIIIAGISASFSRSNLKRGLMLNGWGIIVTLATLITVPDSAIFFGILNFLGCSLLLLMIFKRWINSRNWIIWGACSLILYFLFWRIERGWIGLGTWKLMEIPDVLYQFKALIPFGIHGNDFFSSDYFPILPWFFLFMTGYALAFGIEKSSGIKKILSCHIPVLSQLGRKSLIVYLIHQPAAMLICMLLFA